MIECADYDSMGNHGRFCKRRDNRPSLVTRFIDLIKKNFYVKRR